MKKCLILLLALVLCGSLLLSSPTLALGPSWIDGDWSYITNGSWEGTIALYIGEDVSSVTVPSSLPHAYQVKTFGGAESGVFKNCSLLKRVTISNGIASIGSYAFRDCTSLVEVTIPDSITSIGSYAFFNCSSLKSVIIPQGITNINYNTFFGCSSLTSVTIPDSVTSIYDFAFSGCSALTDMVIPEGVTIIGTRAFSGCKSLTNLVIPSSVKKIERYAFAECSSLTNITIPDGVTRIEEYIFDGCNALTDIWYGGNSAQWEEIKNNLGIPLTATVHFGTTNAPQPQPVSVQTPTPTQEPSQEVTPKFPPYLYVDGNYSLPIKINGRTYNASATVTDGVCSIDFTFSCPALYQSGDRTVRCYATIYVWGISAEGTLNDSTATFHFDGTLSQAYPLADTTMHLQFFLETKDPTSDSTMEYGVEKDYNLAVDESVIPLVKATPTPQPSEKPEVILSPQNLTVNGVPVNCMKYNIDGSNYFKLRDLAYLLNGTGSQFNVGWDGVRGIVSITTHSAYTSPDGHELEIGADMSDTAAVSKQTIMINGAVCDLEVFNIGGSNYFKLRALGDALGFDVEYDITSNTAIVRSRY